MDLDIPAIANAERAANSNSSRCGSSTQPAPFAQSEQLPLVPRSNSTSGYFTLFDSASCQIAKPNHEEGGETALPLSRPAPAFTLASTFPIRTPRQEPCSS